MYYTIYKITNKNSGKHYIGAHKTTDLQDDYVGSGTYLKRAIKKHGWERFEKEILHVFDNEVDMYNKENELVNEEFVLRKDTYNLKEGGQGGWDHINSNIELRKKKNRKAMEIANANGASAKGAAKMKHLRERDVDWSNELSKKIVDSNRKNNGQDAFKTMQGKNHSTESKEKISKAMKKKGHGSSNSQFGTMWINNGLENIKIKKEEFDLYKDTWSKGKIKVTCISCGIKVASSHLNLHKKTCKG